MTVASTTNKVSYTATASQTTFAYTFKIFADADLKVYVNDVLKTLTTDYTVTNAGVTGGGNVIFGTGRTASEIITIERVITATQLTDYVENDPFAAETHENALDKLTMLAQQNESASNNSVRAPTTDVNPNMLLDKAATRATKMMGFDSNGDVAVSGSTMTDIDASVAAAFAGGVLASSYQFTGTGSQVAFTITGGVTDIPNAQALIITIDGVTQHTDTYTTAAAVVTFSTAPPLNADIQIRYNAYLGDANDASGITYNQGGTGASSRTVENKLQESVSVKDFGAVGDGVTDDSTTIQAAIDSGAKKVFIPVGTYKLVTEIVIPGGVTVIGEGEGDQPNSSLAGGTMLLGGTTSMTVVRMTGAFAGLEDLVVMNASGVLVSRGVHLDADGNGLSTLALRNVFIYGINGTGMYLLADNGGYIAYSNFHNLRIRNCGVCLDMNGTGTSSSFVNTNQFWGGAFSGGTTSYGIRARGAICNDNKFYGMSVEVSAPTSASISVEDSASIFFEGRLEAGGIAYGVPIVSLAAGTAGSYLKGIGSGLIIDRGQNDIYMGGSKSPQPRKSSFNLLNNSTLSKITATTVSGWTKTLTGTATASFTSAPSTTVHDTNTLVITVTSGGILTLHQDLPLASAIAGKSYTCGCYIKTSTPGPASQVSWYGDGSVLPVTAGQPHPGDGETHWLGHKRDSDAGDTYQRAGLSINNTSGVDMVVEITMPVVVVGGPLPIPSPPVLTAGRATMSGTLSTNFGTTTASASLMVLPRDGNKFVITGTTSITRINQLAADRFPTGATITLFAGSADLIAVADASYLLLAGSFTAVSPWDNLTLTHIGGGQWAEVSRTFV